MKYRYLLEQAMMFRRSGKAEYAKTTVKANMVLKEIKVLDKLA